MTERMRRSASIIIYLCASSIGAGPKKTHLKPYVGLRYEQGRHESSPIPGAPEVKPSGGWAVKKASDLSIKLVRRDHMGMLWLERRLNQTEKQVMDVLELKEQDFKNSMSCGMKGSNDDTTHVAVVKQLDADGCKLEAVRAWAINVKTGRFEKTDSKELECVPECCGPECN